MMKRLRSIPPYTTGSRRPARCAMSVKLTGQLEGTLAATGGGPCGPRALVTPATRKPAQKTGTSRPATDLAGRRTAENMSAARLPLQAFGDVEVPLGVGGPAHLLQQLAEQVVGRSIVGIVLNRSREHAFRRGELTSFRVRL